MFVFIATLHLVFGMVEIKRKKESLLSSYDVLPITVSEIIFFSLSVTVPEQ